jgi:uncharacterized phage protein (TIGR02218 family)
MKVPFFGNAAQLNALLLTNNFLIGDLYSFTLVDGAQDFFSALDIPVVLNGTVYRADGLRIEGLKYKTGIGLQVDSQQVRIGAYPSDTLAGALFLSGVGAGLLDGAYLTRSRAFWQRQFGVPSLDYAQTPIAAVALSTMLISQIDKIGRTHVEMTVKSPTKLLDLDMPRNYYSPGCIHTLFDAGCNLTKSTFGVSGRVASVGQLAIQWNGGVPNATGADGLPTYAQGRLLFTSGVNANTQFSLSSNDSNNLNLLYPFSDLPNPGDEFVAYPGCAKTMNTCTSKFNNLLNFRGFPFAPQVYVSV